MSDYPQKEEAIYNGSTPLFRMSSDYNLLADLIEKNMTIFCVVTYETGIQYPTKAFVMQYNNGCAYYKLSNDDSGIDYICTASRKKFISHLKRLKVEFFEKIT